MCGIIESPSTEADTSRRYHYHVAPTAVTSSIAQNGLQSKIARGARYDEASGSTAAAQGGGTATIHKAHVGVIRTRVRELFARGYTPEEITNPPQAASNFSPLDIRDPSRSSDLLTTSQYQAAVDTQTRGRVAAWMTEHYPERQQKETVTSKVREDTVKAVGRDPNHPLVAMVQEEIRERGRLEMYTSAQHVYTTRGDKPSEDTDALKRYHGHNPHADTFRFQGQSGDDWHQDPQDTAAMRTRRRTGIHPSRLERFTGTQEQLRSDRQRDNALNWTPLRPRTRAESQPPLRSTRAANYRPNRSHSFS